MGDPQIEPANKFPPKDLWLAIIPLVYWPTVIAVLSKAPSRSIGWNLTVLFTCVGTPLIVIGVWYLQTAYQKPFNVKVVVFFSLLMTSIAAMLYFLVVASSGLGGGR